MGLIIIAGRSQVDWDGAVKTLCETTFAATMGTDGRYPGIYTVLNSIEGSDFILVDPAWRKDTAEEAIETFCASHSWDWGEKFFGPMPTSAGVTQPAALDDLSTLCDGDLETLAKDPDFPDSRKLICYTNYCAAANAAGGCTVFWGRNTILDPNIKVEVLRASLGRQAQLKILCVVLALVSSFLFLRGASKLMEYVDLPNLISFTGLIVLVISTLGRSSLTKVVSVDLILFGMWKSHDDLDNILSSESSESRMTALKSFDKLLKPTSSKASAAVAPE
ncbi:hypothetical protein TrRE_jg3323 [Triparma retinervis]|uniref:Uncharacterized protein n=1 Tax=Triparma retinervis TaxID=2557542 RepID=A0A9W7AE77_9STRA|nr:hypothetical protein TrRE_jg3323 [Triparma retinervis]